MAATAGNNIGKVLQKKCTPILPPLSFKFKVIKAYAFNKIWVTGFLMDTFGAVLMLRALSLAPVSVSQPVSGCGLAILSIFSHFYLEEIMNAVDWMGIALASIGTTGYMQSEVVEEIIYGLESGILFGFAILIKQTRGLKHGRAIIVSTSSAVTSIVTGALAGMLALGERLPSAPVTRLLLLLRWLFIIMGVVLLVSSTRLVWNLPRPLCCFVQISIERNFGPKQSGALRARESSPSAVIQATTLHHLISFPSLEKA